MKTLHFKSKEAFRKWEAYRHIRTKTGKIAKAKHGRHSLAELTKEPRVVIAGHVHSVKHRPFVHDGEVKKIKHNLY